MKHALVPFLQGTIHFAARVFLLHGFALIVTLLAARNAKFHLGTSAPQMNLQRDNRQTLLLNLADQARNLFLM
jgi:hypothetical protein